jgi:hypothetical protein
MRQYFRNEEINDHFIDNFTAEYRFYINRVVDADDDDLDDIHILNLNEFLDEAYFRVLSDFLETTMTSVEDYYKKEYMSEEE